MTPAEVTQWYRHTVANMGRWVDKSLPLSEQLNEARRIHEFIMKSVRNAVYSQSAYQAFVAAAGAAIPSRSTMRAWKALPEFRGMTGQKQLEAILKKYTEIKLSVQKYEPACFAGGTLVHTKNGLVPIEQIQVGDWVLSKHESGEGERKYKRVTKTFVHEDRQVIRVAFGGKQADGSTRYHFFIVTPEHPIWVQGKGWKPAEKLKLSLPLMKTEFVVDESPNIYGNTRLFVTDKPDIAWVPSTNVSSDLGRFGCHINVHTLEMVADHVALDFESVRKTGRVKQEHLFRTTVYNIEVEDFHTYYVGKAGVWVHNKNIQTATAAPDG